MSGLRGDQDEFDGTAATGDVAGGDELLSPGVWAGPSAGVYDAVEARCKREMANAARSGDAPALRKADATFAALHTYRAVYGNEVGFDADPILVDLYHFWLDRFGRWSATPFWARPAQDQETAAPREDPR